MIAEFNARKAPRRWPAAGALLAALVVASSLPGSAGAAAEAAGGEAPAISASPAPLRFENRTIVVFRASVLGRTPLERAEGARQRIEQAIGKGGAGAVTTRALPQGTAVEIDGTAMFVVTPQDVDEPVSETLPPTVEEAVRTLKVALEERHEQYDFWGLLKAAGFAALATLIYAALLYAIVAANRWLTSRLAGVLQARVEKLKVAGVIALLPSQVLVIVQRLILAAAWIVALFATVIWLSRSLGLFPYTRPWGEQLTGFLIDLLRSIVLAVAHAVPGLLIVAVIFAITRFVVGLVAGFFRRVEAQHIRIAWLDEHTARPTQRIIAFVLWLFALAMAYPYLPGAETDAFKGLSVLVGLMVSIGASGLVGQAASGMILMYSRALRKGDYVKIGEAAGTVGEMGMLALRLHTGTGEELVLPNAFVVANMTRNFSREAVGRGFVTQVTVTIGYSTPWRQVHAMLLEAARRTQGMLREPAPYVIQAALSDFYVEYKLVAYAEPETPAERAVVISDLNSNVQDVFNEHGVQIMSPHYFNDPKEPQIVPKERWFEPPAQKPKA